MLINAAEVAESRIAVIQNGKLEEYYTQRRGGEQGAGNIYKGIVSAVERSLQAAFVNINGPVNGFLQLGDVSYDLAEKDRKTKKPSGHRSNDRTASSSGGQRRSRGDTHPRIQNLLHRGQEILVQITKEAIGSKGPALTTFLSIPGRYLVLMPYSTHIGVSKKIEDENTRRKLKAMLKELSPPQGAGYIIRTAGADRTKTELKKDLSYLTRLWKAIERKARSMKAPALVYKESNLGIRTVRDIFTTDMEEIITDSREVHRDLTEFFNAVMPRYADRVKLFDSAKPLFDRYDVESLVEEIFKREIAFPQGGGIVIEETEALVAVDVNSGRFKTGSAEETAYKINMHAAEEITRQIKLRDLGGLIVIDFIDMKSSEHVRKLEKQVRFLMRADRARYSMTRLSRFGLMQITRQRLRPSLTRRSSGVCPQCGGTGRIRNLETISLHALRKIKAELLRSGGASVKVLLHPQVAQDFHNNMRAELVNLENMYSKKIIVCSAPLNEIGQVRIEQTG
jgi:ribonuclease E